MTAADPHSVLIVGAGPAGLCLARAMAAHGLAVNIVDCQPEATLAEPAFDGREIALSHKSIRILEQLGIWDRIPEAEIHPLCRALISDGADEGFTVSPSLFGKDRLGSLVSNHHIRAAAWQAVRDTNSIHVHMDAKVESIERKGSAIAVRLTDGRCLDAPLLVAADSRFSQVRRQLGVPAIMHDFGKTMLVCRMHHDVPHKSMAHEWFGHGQTRALLPLDEHVVSLVLTVTGSEASTLQAMEEVAFAHNIETRLQDQLGAMQLISSRHTYPLVATWAKQFVGPGFALVGDAAVGMHPITAHGFNLGLSSVCRLAHAVGLSLTKYGRVAHPNALARYQRHHRAHAWPLFVGTGAIVGLYTNDHALAQPLRHAIITGMRWLPPLRDTLAAAVTDAAPPEKVLGLLRGIARSSGNATVS